jgi:hypothetical protein
VGVIVYLATLHKRPNADTTMEFDFKNQKISVTAKNGKLDYEELLKQIASVFQANGTPVRSDIEQRP